MKKSELLGIGYVVLGEFHSLICNSMINITLKLF